MPGYGQSARPEWAREPRDLAILLLQALCRLGLSRVALVGLGFEEFVAAEMATMSPSAGSVVDINALRALAPLPRAPVPRPSRPKPPRRPPAGAAGTAHISLRARQPRPPGAVSGMLGARTAAVKRQMDRPGSAPMMFAWRRHDAVRRAREEPIWARRCWTQGARGQGSALTGHAGGIPRCRTPAAACRRATPSSRFLARTARTTGLARRRATRCG